MALTLVTDCPHCGANECFFAYLASRKSHDNRSCVSVWTCNRCNGAVCKKLLTDAPNPMRFDFITNSNGDFNQAMERLDDMAHVSDSYPVRKSLDAPEHVSSNVARAFVQAETAAQIRHHDAAAAMYRKALDVATRELDPELSKLNLAGRIDKLQEQGKLTNDLKEWAHAIRLDGNQGAHDEVELTDDEMSQLANFARLFLMYTFTLPAQVSMRKAAK